MWQVAAALNRAALWLLSLTACQVSWAPQDESSTKTHDFPGQAQCERKNKINFSYSQVNAIALILERFQLEERNGHFQNK